MNPKGAVMVDAHGQRFFSDSLPLRIIDWLEHDGGWHSERALALRLKARREHVQRSLWHLKARGLVVHRRPGEWKAE